MTRLFDPGSVVVHGLIVEAGEQPLGFLRNHGMSLRSSGKFADRIPRFPERNGDEFGFAAGFAAHQPRALIPLHTMDTGKDLAAEKMLVGVGVFRLGPAMP